MKVGVIGATGIVGQRFVHLLEEHPFFELTELVASSRSEGKKYSNAVNHLVKPIPEKFANMEVKTYDQDLDCDLVFSALPSGAAKKIEGDLAERGFVVASNASYHRMDEDVPLVIPEVNPKHLDLIEIQRNNRDTDGYIVTNPNCSTIQLAISLKPLHEKYTVEGINVVTMQAISGSGYPGVASLDITDNILPYIDGEEEKLKEEPLKLFGDVNNRKIDKENIKVSASCNRVNVVDSHLENVSISLKEEVGLNELKKTMSEFKGLPQELKLPTAPSDPIVVMEDPNRPQPRLDRNKENSMATVVGRVREDPIMDFKFLVLGHNTIRGAAGASVLNAELLYKKGLIKQ